MRISTTSLSLRKSGSSWVGQSTAAIAACLLLAFGVLGTPGNAAAQDIDALLQRKYDILQQQADTERKRAETESKRVEAESRNTGAQTAQYSGNSSASSFGQTYHVPRGDALAGTNAATYRLVNGVILRASGDFLPDPPGVCIAYCK